MFGLTREGQEQLRPRPLRIYQPTGLDVPNITAWTARSAAKEEAFSYGVYIAYDYTVSLAKNS